MAGLPAQPTTAIPADATLLQIEQDISQAQAALEKLRKALADDEEELKGRASSASQDPRANQRREETAGRHQRPASGAAAERREAGA